MMFRRLILPLLAGVSASAGAQTYHPLEPVEIPPSIQQGVDLIYIDPQIAPAVRERHELLEVLGIEKGPGAPIDLLVPVNPFYTELRRGLSRYRASWGALPQVAIPSGPVLKPGVKDPRVAILRERLGLRPGSDFDAELSKAVRRYQQAHGMKADGIAGSGTITSLNLGAAHYERLLMINMERARRLPTTAERDRYVLVDVGAARIYLFEDGRVQDSMKAIVGKPASATPMMAALIRYASVNPYWNVPPDLVQTLIAPHVVSGGLGYLDAERYQVLSGWEHDATVLDPATVDWTAVRDGKIELRVRQLPGRANSMGRIKFMLPNDYGIYLHDTPDKSLFQKDDRWLSNGCVRVEDAQRLAKWLFGEMPSAADPNVEEDVKLAKPVPVYITYMTAGSTAEGPVFRKDPYQRDPALLARYFGASEELALAGKF